MCVHRPCKTSPVNYQHCFPTVQETLGTPGFLTSGDRGPPVITAPWSASPARWTAPQPSEMGKVEARGTTSSFPPLFLFLPGEAVGTGSGGTGRQERSNIPSRGPQHRRTPAVLERKEISRVFRRNHSKSHTDLQELL